MFYFVIFVIVYVLLKDKSKINCMQMLIVIYHYFSFKTAIVFVCVIAHTATDIYGVTDPML